MTAADRVQEAPRPGHGAPGRHSAYPAGPARPPGRRPTAWVVAPSVCSAVLAAAAIVIVVNGAHSAGYHLSGATTTAVWVLGGLILAVVVATLAFAGRPGPTAELPSFPDSESRQAPPVPMPQAQPHSAQAPGHGPGPGPQQAPQAPPAPPMSPMSPMSPQVAAHATEAAATLAAATKAASCSTSISDEGVDLQVIFAQLVRRLLTLVLQQINRLDELENEVEDPKLLKSLFGIDHQATQVRRYGENIGVLVGALPQRQWTHPVPVTVAQRSAVSETPDYPRVQVIPRAPGRIHGHAVSDVIHILSELVENATNYSNPTTKVTVGAHRVSAGLAIEINDHGIGMEPDQFRRLNTLLRDPSGANVRDLLSQGRIGLSVVAKMAQRHGIAVELAPNVTGGTMALVVIPDALLAPEELPADKGRQPRRTVDTTQLPARPALAPLPDALPQSSGLGTNAANGATLAPATPAPPSSAALLSPVAASAPPLPSPATTQAPPLPSGSAHMPLPSGAAAQEPPRTSQPTPVRAAVPPPLSAQPLSGQSLPTTAQPSQPASAPTAAQTGLAPFASPSAPGSAVAQPDPASFASRQAPAPFESPSAPAPFAAPARPGYAQPNHPQTGYPQPSHARPAPAPQPPAEPQWPSTTPPRPAAADPYTGQAAGSPAPPWSRPGEQASEPAPGLLPDGRPQLRRRTPQGHISSRLIQAEAQESRHAAGALSPTMMSDFWQGLSSGTAPADPPAAGPDPSQHDRTTANRQEWNQ